MNGYLRPGRAIALWVMWIALTGLVHQGAYGAAQVPFEGQYVVLNNVMHGDQRLRAGHGGGSSPGADWGAGDAHFWQVEGAGAPGVYYLRNRLHGDKRLHVGHNGNGQLYAQPGSDAAFQWTFEDAGEGAYYLRNQLHNGQRLHVGHDGNGQLYAQPGTDDAFRWHIYPEGSLPEHQIPSDLPAHLYGTHLMLINDLLQSQRLHVSHDGSGQLYAESGHDEAYHWTILPSGDGDWAYLENRMYPDQRLHVGHNGNGQLYAAPGNDDAFKWIFEARGDGSYFIQNKLHLDQRLHVGHNHNGQLYASWGSDDAFGWSLIPLYHMPEFTPNSIQIPGELNGAYVLLQSAFSEARRLVTNGGNPSQAQLEWGDDDRFWWRVVSVDGTYFYLENKADSARRLHVGHNGNGHLYVQSGSDAAYQWHFEAGGTGADGEPRYFIRNRLHIDQRLHPNPGDPHGIEAAWGQGNSFTWHALTQGDLPFGWVDQASQCQNPSTDYYFCYFSGENQSGRAHCRPVERYTNWDLELLFDHSIPEGVRFNTRSIELERCAGDAPPMNAIVYSRDRLSSAAVIGGATGNLHPRLGGKAGLIILVNQGMPVLCVHQDVGFNGHTRCQPGVPEHDWYLTDNFERQISSISVNFDTTGCYEGMMIDFIEDESSSSSLTSTEPVRESLSNLNNEWNAMRGGYVDSSQTWNDVISGYQTQSKGDFESCAAF